MAEPPTGQRRETAIGRKLRAHLQQRVKLFLDNGVAMDGVLLDYFWDPTERDGCISLSNPKDPAAPPSLIFRSFVTTVQPMSDDTNRNKKKGN